MRFLHLTWLNYDKTEVSRHRLSQKQPTLVSVKVWCHLSGRGITWERVSSSLIFRDFYYWVAVRSVNGKAQIYNCAHKTINRLFIVPTVSWIIRKHFEVLTRSWYMMLYWSQYFYRLVTYFVSVHVLSTRVTKVRSNFHCFFKWSKIDFPPVCLSHDVCVRMYVEMGAMSVMRRGKLIIIHHIYDFHCFYLYFS